MYLKIHRTRCMFSWAGTCLRAGKSSQTGAGCLGTLVSNGSSADFFEQIMNPICPLQVYGVDARSRPRASSSGISAVACGISCGA